jgi:hypothetical protein
VGCVEGVEELGFHAPWELYVCHFDFSVTNLDNILGKEAVNSEKRVLSGNCNL